MPAKKIDDTPADQPEVNDETVPQEPAVSEPAPAAPNFATPGYRAEANGTVIETF